MRRGISQRFLRLKGRMARVLAMAAAVCFLAQIHGIEAFAATAGQYDCIFDAGYYAASYPDLAAVFGDNETALFNHFVTCGMAEGRQGSAEFEVNSYRAAYPDLQAAFGDDLPAYYSHYMNNGKAEGRVGAGTSPAAAAQTPAVPQTPEAAVPAAPQTAAGYPGLADVPVGSVITLGSYEQDNNAANGQEPIVWYVLDKSGGEAFLLAVNILDSRIYGEYEDAVSWEDCSLRSWLNNEFYNTAFSAEEKAVIADSYVVNANNPYNFGGLAGNDTIDKVFCMSLEEVGTYLHIDCNFNSKVMSWEDFSLNCYNQNHRILAAPTAYAHANGAYVLTQGDARFHRTDVSYAVGSGDWWLRSPGWDTNYASRVDTCGGVDSVGRSVAFMGGSGVRPAMRVRY